MNNAKVLSAQTLQHKHSSLPRLHIPAGLYSFVAVWTLTYLSCGSEDLKWDTFAFSVTLSDACVAVYIQVFSTTTSLQGLGSQLFLYFGKSLNVDITAAPGLKMRDFNY